MAPVSDLESYLDKVYAEEIESFKNQQENKFHEQKEELTHEMEKRLEEERNRKEKQLLRGHNQKKAEMIVAKRLQLDREIENSVTNIIKEAVEEVRSRMRTDQNIKREFYKNALAQIYENEPIQEIHVNTELQEIVEDWIESEKIDCVIHTTANSDVVVYTGNYQLEISPSSITQTMEREIRDIVRTMILEGNG